MTDIQAFYVSVDCKFRATLKGKYGLIIERRDEDGIWEIIIDKETFQYNEIKETSKNYNIPVKFLNRIWTLYSDLTTYATPIK